MGSNNGRFSDGFLMGAIIGGAAVFLLGTEKGNKVLKVMIQEGRAGLSDLMDEIDEYKGQARDLMEIVEEDDEIDEVEEEKMSQASEVEVSERKESTHPDKNSSSSKRFFKKGK